MRRRLPLSFHLNRRGSALISVMLGFGLLGISAYTILHFNELNAKSGKHLKVHATAEQIKQKLVGYIISPECWQQIQLNNPEAFANVQTSGSSSQGLDIYTSELPAKIFYKGSSATAGFDMNGEPCADDNPFDASVGNDRCPFHYDLTLVQHVIVNGNWVDTIRFSLKFKPASIKVPFKSANTDFSFELVRNLNDKSTEYSCISLNGVYYPKTATCSVQLTAAVTCPQSAKAFRGPASNTTGQNCEKPILKTASCTGGNAIQGFDSQGNPKCAPVN